LRLIREPLANQLLKLLGCGFGIERVVEWFLVANDPAVVSAIDTNCARNRFLW